MKNRFCALCGRKLSVYNHASICFCHTVKEKDKYQPPSKNCFGGKTGNRFLVTHLLETGHIKYLGDI